MSDKSHQALFDALPPEGKAAYLLVEEKLKDGRLTPLQLMNQAFNTGVKVASIQSAMILEAVINEHAGMPKVAH